MRKSIWGLVCGIAVVVSAGGIAHANGTCVWQGSGNGVHARFSGSNNWSCNAVPGSGDGVYFDTTMGGSNGACTFDVAVNVASIHVQNGYTAGIRGSSNDVTVAGDWVMTSANAVSGMSGTVTVGGSLSISAGSYTATSGTTQVSGSFSAASGTFLPSTGTLVLAGSGNVTSSGNSLSILTVSGTGTYTLQNGLTVAGALSITSGTLDAETQAISAGSWSNAGTFTFTAPQTVTLTSSGTLTSGGSSFNALTLNGTGTSSLSGNLTATGALTLTAGTLDAGSNTVQAGSVAVQSGGTLTLASGSTLAVGSALTMDGTLAATSSTIKGVSGSYAFQVGSTATARPTLNINGLAVQNTDSNGMFVNANSSAVTTFTRFDKLAFSSGTGTQLLQIFAPALNLTSSGCTFDGSTTVAVTLTGNGTGSGAGPRAMFGNATCATNDPATGLCATSEKSDDDANNDGIADHPATDGAVVQFVRAVETDTAGTIVGFPTAAFDWSTFSYYSTYVTFHAASGGADVIYVRDESGTPLYSWTDPSTSETITGTPQWTTVSGTHYLYVSVNGATNNSGKVYRLKDTATGTTSGSLTLDASWGTAGAFSCTCNITSDLSLDANNIYWAATNGKANKPTQVLMGIIQSSAANISTGWPVTTPANVTTSSPTLFTQSGTTTLYLGVTNDLLQLAVTGTTFVQNTNPGTITGRVSVGASGLPATAGAVRVYAGDSAGTLWAISPTSFTGTSFLWSYAAGSAISNNYYDPVTDTIQFGTSGGTIVALNAAGSGTGGSLLNTSYPFTLNASDPITAAPLFINGVLAVGTSQGKLYFIDRNTGLSSPNGVSIIRQYSFGSTESVSTVGYNVDTDRYMVATSSSAGDGRLYYFDGVSDPTPTAQ